MQASESVQNEVKALASKILKAYSAKDLDGVMNHFTSDPEVFVFGVGQGDERKGQDDQAASLALDFDYADEIEYKLHELHVNMLGEVLWARGLWSFHAVMGGAEMNFTGRLTGVAIREDNTWKMVQLHLSLPADIPSVAEQAD